MWIHQFDIMVILQLFWFLSYKPSALWLSGLVLQDGSKSYQGILSMISLFKRIKDEVDKSDSVNPKEMFGNFHTELVQEIRGLFQRMNYQGDKEALGGLLHMKVFGNVIIFLI